MHYNKTTKFIINQDSNLAGVNGGHAKIRNGDSLAVPDRDVVFQGRNFMSSTNEELAIYFLVEKIHELEQKVSHVQGLEQTISAMKEVEHSLRSDLKRLNGDRRDLRESFTRIKRKNEALEAENEELKRQVERYRGMSDEDLHALENENSSLISTNIDLQVENRDLKALVTRLQDKEEENTQLKDRVQELVDQVDEVWQNQITAEVESKTVGHASVVNIHCSGMSGADLVLLINNELIRDAVVIDKTSRQAEEIMGVKEQTYTRTSSNEQTQEVLSDIQDERVIQRQKWGVEKDDNNDAIAWRSYIHSYSLKAYNAFQSKDYDDAYLRFIQVAALGTAAAESLRRRNLLEKW